MWKPYQFGCHVSISTHFGRRFIIPMCKRCNETRYGEWIPISIFCKVMELPKCNCGHLENIKLPFVAILWSIFNIPGKWLIRLCIFGIGVWIVLISLYFGGYICLLGLAFSYFYFKKCNTL